MIEVRPARTSDIKAIHKLIVDFASGGRMLQKETVTLYESVQEFVVAVQDGQVVGCGALHVLWEDLAEVRSVAITENLRGNGIGNQILERIIDRARELGLSRIFCLTFETKFFGRHGFEEIQGTPVEPEVYTQLLKSYDSGVAEFLDLESVKPNTLGNTRMLKIL
ncbi:MAG: amino-acid N-acetyltransferase [Actinobacteria bacterium]|nr:amino-acid N-acetyltransferase [Actinomycetota bacterium]